MPIWVAHLYRISFEDLKQILIYIMLFVRDSYSIQVGFDNITSGKSKRQQIGGHTLSINAVRRGKGANIIPFEACLFNLTFYKGNHSKGLKQRTLHVHQRKTKHFIAKLFVQPFMVLQTFWKSMANIVSKGQALCTAWTQYGGERGSKKSCGRKVSPLH